MNKHAYPASISGKIKVKSRIKESLMEENTEKRTAEKGLTECSSFEKDPQIKNKSKRAALPFHRIAKGRGVILALVALAGCLMLSSCGLGMLGQNTETFKKAFSEDAIAQKGIASNDFLNDSKYEVVDFQTKEMKKEGKQNVSANFSATIENENFKTDVSGIARFEKVKDAKNGGIYLFEVQTNSTTPKKGIDFDAQKNPIGDSAALSEDKRSCVASTSNKYEFWFADSALENQKTYVFDGKKWVSEKTDTKHAVKYKDIEGNYAAKSGGLSKSLSSFTISNLDENKGTFSVAYGTKSMESRSTSGTYPEGIGEFSVTIDPKNQDGEYRLDDGCSYYFEATGTNSLGADYASIKGCFTKSTTNNEKTIEITDFTVSADYTNAFSKSPQTEKLSLGKGTLYKQ